MMSKHPGGILTNNVRLSVFVGLLIIIAERGVNRVIKNRRARVSKGRQSPYDAKLERARSSRLATKESGRAPEAFL